MQYKSGATNASTVSEMKNVLIVSPYYPPGPTACAHRARLLAKYLGNFGWRPLVLCVDERFLEERLDYGLIALTSRDVEVVKSSALPIRLARPFGIGEVTLRSWFATREDINRLMRKRSFDAVLFTGAHFYSMLHAPMVRKRFGVPIVLDFHDPWVSARRTIKPRFSKAWASDHLATILEPRAVKAANFITSVSDVMNIEMRARYPSLSSERMASIPIGGDPDDYDALRTQSSTEGGFELDPLRFNLSYVGTIWPAVVGTLRAMLQAVADVHARRPDVYSRLRLNFIGTTENRNAPDGRWVRQLAETAGVADVVREQPQRLPYLEALSLQARSDAILMLGSAEPHYTASKIYGAMMSGRPFLSVYHEDSSSHEILSRAGGGLAIGFNSATSLTALIRRLADALVCLVSETDTIGRSDSAAYADFTALNITKRYAAIFDQLQNERLKSAS
jgi:hypothetical protein